MGLDQEDWRCMMRLIFLAVLMAVFTAAPAFADDKSSKKAVINSVQISGTSI